MEQHKEEFGTRQEKMIRENVLMLFVQNTKKILKDSL